MSAPTAPHAPGDAIGRRRLSLGGALGLGGGAVGIALPLVGLLGVRGPPTLATAEADALAIAALLLFLSLLAYRSSFRALRQADRRFRHASHLCLVGSIGFLLVLVAAAYFGGSADRVTACFAGTPAQTVDCLRAAAPGEPAGGTALTAVALLGAALAWVGSVGIVAGLTWEARRIRSAALGAGAILYALTLLVLLGPFAAYALNLPVAADSLDLVPVVGLLAPACVLAGSWR